MEKGRNFSFRVRVITGNNNRHIHALHICAHPQHNTQCDGDVEKLLPLHPSFVIISFFMYPFLKQILFEIYILICV